MKRADKLGVNYTFIIGEEELNRGLVKIRNMKESTEEDMKFDDVKNSYQKFKS
ncbi:MAG: His/Gly/Thr/Pro-type tRNA ligase C-terminal domain-containing protein [Ignavibacteriaceae bacterium]